MVDRHRIFYKTLLSTDSLQCEGRVELFIKVPDFPYYVRCYNLVSRGGAPPHPEDAPVAEIKVTSQEEVDEAYRKLREEYPGGWLVDCPESAG
jgi:hypothetical protein